MGQTQSRRSEKSSLEPVIAKLRVEGGRDINQGSGEGCKKLSQRSEVMQMSCDRNLALGEPRERSGRSRNREHGEALSTTRLGRWAGA